MSPIQPFRHKGIIGVLLVIPEQWGRRWRCGNSHDFLPPLVLVQFRAFRQPRATQWHVRCVTSRACSSPSRALRSFFPFLRPLPAALARCIASQTDIVILFSLELALAPSPPEGTSVTA